MRQIIAQLGLAAALLLGSAPPMAAQAGDPAFVSGPAAPDDLGPAPAGGVALASLDIRNDTAVDRTDELAYSSVPIARSRDLRSTDSVALIGPGERLLNAQFRVTSRWGGPVSDTSLPIRWLEVATRANVPAQSTVHYSLRLYASPLRGTNLLQGSGPTYSIDTGPALFEIDSGLVGVLDRIWYGSELVYADTAAAGPRLLDTGDALITPALEPDGFRVEQNGPVKAVVRSAGRFARSTASACSVPMRYEVRMTFVRGSAVVNMEIDLHNECGDGFSLDWSGNRQVVNQFAWQFPLQLDAAGRRSFLATDTTVHVSAAGFSGDAEIEQRLGSTGTPAWRRARAVRDGSVLESPAAFARPLVGLGDAAVTAALQMPWMQWREPQALASRGDLLVLELLSDRAGVGEAQQRWHFAQLRFFPGNATAGTVATERDRGIAELERGLLIHAPVSYLNATGVLPRLPEAGSGVLLDKYTELIGATHDSTVPGQWLGNKNFGITWPDIPAISYSNTSPSQYDISSNYWSPTSSEMLEYFRTGDPRWYWDFAFPAEQTFWKTIVYNAGSNRQPGDIRTGFGVGKGAVSPEGAAYRDVTSSDDYFYNQGSDEFYVVRPHRSIQEVMAQSCRTFLERYDAPRNQGERWVSRMEITRQVMQHVNALRFAAEFVEDPTLAAACTNKLREVMQELSEDNFKGGITCWADSGNETACETDDSFMHAGLHLDVILGYLRNYDDHTVVAGGQTVNGVIRNMAVEMAWQYYQEVVTRNGAEIDPFGDWYNALRCTFTQSGTQISSCSGIRFAEPLYDHARPMTLATMLLGYELDPSMDVCDPVVRAMSSSMDGEFRDYHSQGNGWVKGTSQSMRLIAHGVGIAELCAGALPGNSVCGNGQREAAEECDDGNQNDGDGCDSNCTVTGCGNAVVTAGEQCDDGNTADGDCCSASCTFEAAGSSCGDGDVCNGNEQCDGAGTCQAGTALTCEDGDPCTRDTCDPVAGCMRDSGPATGCFLPRRAALVIVDHPWDRRDRMRFVWIGDGIDAAELGDPTAGTDYAICLWDEDAGVATNVARIDVPAGIDWRANRRGYRYLDRSWAQDGVGILKLGASARRSWVALAAARESLPLPTPFSPDRLFAQDPALTVQVMSSAGSCWSATFTEDRRNNDLLYVARQRR